MSVAQLNKVPLVNPLGSITQDLKTIKTEFLQAQNQINRTKHLGQYYNLANNKYKDVSQIEAEFDQQMQYRTK